MSNLFRFGAALALCRLAPLWSVFILLSVAASGDEDLGRFGRGPLETRDPFPVAQIHLGLAPVTATTVPRGKSEVRAAVDWTTTFATHGDSFTFDSESRVVDLAFVHGVTDDLEVGFRVGYLWRGGGILDEVVDRFHNAFDLPDGGRADAPRDDFLNIGFAPDSLFAELDRGGSVTDLVVSAKHRLFKSDSAPAAVAVEGEVSFPVAREQFGAESVDGGIQIVGGWDLGRANLFGGMGWTVYGDTHVEGIQLSKHRLHSFLAMEWEATEDISTIVQVQGANRLIQNLESFPSVSLYIVLGIKWGLGDGVELETTLIENLVDQDATADFGLRLGLSVRF